MKKNNPVNAKHRSLRYSTPAKLRVRTHTRKSKNPEKTSIPIPFELVKNSETLLCPTTYKLSPESVFGRLVVSVEFVVLVVSVVSVVTVDIIMI